MNTTRTGSITHTIGNASYDVDYVARWSPGEKQTHDYPGSAPYCEIEITNIVREEVVFKGGVFDGHVAPGRVNIEAITVNDLDDDTYDALIEAAQQNECDTEWLNEEDMRDRYQEARDGR